MWDPNDSFLVKYDVSGGITDWSITEDEVSSTEFNKSFETNTTVSLGATVGNVTADAGVTTGFGWDESRSVSWSDALEIGGEIYQISDPGFQTCEYKVVPYIYHAKATTEVGITYPYLEMDYYVKEIMGSCTAISHEPTILTTHFGNLVPK